MPGDWTTPILNTGVVMVPHAEVVSSGDFGWTVSAGSPESIGNVTITDKIALSIDSAESLNLFRSDSNGGWAYYQTVQGFIVHDLYHTEDGPPTLEYIDGEYVEVEGGDILLHFVFVGRFNGEAIYFEAV